MTTFFLVNFPKQDFFMAKKYVLLIFIHIVPSTLKVSTNSINEASEKLMKSNKYSLNAFK